MELPADWTDPAKAEFFRILMALLPGLLTVAIINSLTVKQSLSVLERTIQALLYTFLDNVTWYGFLTIFNFVCWLLTVPRHWRHDWHQHWPIPLFQWHPTPSQQLFFLGLCGVMWGLVMTWVINCGVVHNFLAWVRITKRTSRPTEWYDAFYRFESDYIVVHLKDGRRVFGWPRLYPDTPTEGHLVLEDAEWLRDPPPKETPPLFALVPVLETSQPPAEPPATNASAAPVRLRIMLPATEIGFIEFVPSVQSEETKKDDAELSTGGKSLPQSKVAPESKETPKLGESECLPSPNEQLVVKIESTPKSEAAKEAQPQ